MIQYTQGQQQALKAIDSLKSVHPSGGAVLVINGPAGCGKTRLIKELADSHPNLLVLAPTGKAAVRVRDVAGCRASTIHKWLYKPREDKQTGETLFHRASLLDIDDPGFHSIIVDEGSMVGEELWNDLHDTASQMGLNVVILGDEFQLPPVEANGTGFSVFNSDFKCYRVDLTEVLRQSLESDIIRAATALRMGTDYAIQLSSLPLVACENALQACVDTFEAGGVVLCHKNETRFKLNKDIRWELNHINSVDKTEPLLAIKNNYTINVFNGEIFPINGVLSDIGTKTIKDKYNHSTATVHFKEIELGNGEKVAVAVEQLSGKTGEVGFRAIELGYKSLTKGVESAPHFLHANFGYVLTNHRYQGNETDDVLVLIENTVRPSTYMGRRFLYTALTRAKKTVKICWYTP